MSENPQLSPEELIVLRSILSKFAQSTPETFPEIQPIKKSRGRPKGNKQEKKIQAKKRGRKQNKETVRKPSVKTKSPLEKEPKFIRISRELGGGPNEFETMKDRGQFIKNSHKEDIATDRLLSRKGKLKPTERREISTTKVEVICGGCKRKVKAHPDEIVVGSKYCCNHCCIGRVGCDDEGEE